MKQNSRYTSSSSGQISKINIGNSYEREMFKHFFSFLNFFYTEPILFLEINPEYGLPLCAAWFIINDHTNSLLQVSDTYPGAAIL